MYPLLKPTLLLEELGALSAVDCKVVEIIVGFVHKAICMVHHADVGFTSASMFLDLCWAEPQELSERLLYEFGP